MTTLATVAEVAKRLACSQQQVYALIQRGELPCVRIGSKGIRVNLSDLERWMRRGGCRHIRTPEAGTVLISERKAIGETIDSLLLERNLFDAFTRFVELTAEKISASCPQAQLDPKGETTATFERARSDVKAYYDSLIQKRRAARDDTRLTDSDGVVAEYSSMISAAADLHNALNTLCKAIAEHDADLDDYEDFDSPEKFIEVLRVNAPFSSSRIPQGKENS